MGKGVFAAAYGAAFLVVTMVLLTQAGQGAAFSALSTTGVVEEEPTVYTPRFANLQCEERASGRVDPMIPLRDIEQQSTFFGLTESGVVTRKVAGYNTPSAKLVLHSPSNDSGEVTVWVKQPDESDYTGEWGSDDRINLKKRLGSGGTFFDSKPLLQDITGTRVLVDKIYSDRSFEFGGRPTKVRVEYTGTKPTSAFVGVRFDRYDLVVTGGGVPGTITENSCNVADMGRLARNHDDIVDWFKKNAPGDKTSFSEAEAQQKIVNGRLRFNEIVPIVTGSVPVKEPQSAVDTNGDGQPDKYILQIDPEKGATYWPIVESATGKLYVDQSQRKQDPSILCHPANTVKCSSDGTRILTGDDTRQDVSELSGSVVGKISCHDSTSQWCRYEVQNGELQIVERGDIPDCGDSQRLNQQFKCEEIQQPVGADQTQNVPLWMWVLLVFLGTTFLGTVFVAAVILAGGGA